MDKDKQLSIVQDNLSGLLRTKADALPKNFNETRFIQNCITVLKDTQGIEKVLPQSIGLTLLKGAFLGLDFFQRECYAIPYGNELKFQTDYKGEVKLCKLYGEPKIKEIYAKLVREGDILTEKIENGTQQINFEPIPFNDNPITGAFAVVVYENGSLISEMMSVAEIEKTRDTFSKMPKGKAWTNSFGEMCKKTVLRRLTKNITLVFENDHQDKAYDEGSDANFIEKEIPTISDPFLDATDAEIKEEVKEESEYPEPTTFPEENVPRGTSQKTPEKEELNCYACKKTVTEKVSKYSKDKYGQSLCFECQKFQ